LEFFEVLAMLPAEDTGDSGAALAIDVDIANNATLSPAKRFFLISYILLFDASENNLPSYRGFKPYRCLRCVSPLRDPNTVKD
jgi:hypothetical protein